MRLAIKRIVAEIFKCGRVDKIPCLGLVYSNTKKAFSEAEHLKHSLGQRVGRFRFATSIFVLPGFGVTSTWDNLEE
ncbi:hypothetical protein [Paenibacillus agricola]|uniref:hypothetical protein n=1 Tax=Paenibacillus agricola TaxID=2716264 RepID=UPI001A9E7D7A|nr:hypothetical protein [Paenibacillus agricola]